MPFGVRTCGCMAECTHFTFRPLVIEGMAIFNNWQSRRNLDSSRGAEILLFHGLLGSNFNPWSQHALHLALGCGEVSTSPEQFGVASTSKPSRIVCTRRELCRVACVLAFGMENRLACLCIRPGDTSIDHSWGCLDSCGGTAGWSGWSPTADTLHSSDFSRYGTVLVWNHPAVTPMRFTQTAVISAQNPPR